MKIFAICAAVTSVALAFAMSPGVTVKAVPGKGANGKAPVTVSIAIPEGYHIYGPKETTGISTSVKVKGTAFKAVKVSYPKTKVIKVVGQKLEVYETAVSIPVVLQSTKKVKGVQKVTLQVTSQACNDRVCLPPDTKTIEVNVNFGK